jgi:hypothetical protein
MTPTTPERWLPVVGWEGFYEVSDHGRVRGVDRIDGAGRKVRGRLLAAHAGDAGRMHVRLSRKGRPLTQRVSVLVLRAFIGPRPDGYHGCHNDGDPANNRLTNLRWDTVSANMRDKIQHGRMPQLARTHCPRGHLLASPNLSATHARKGYRTCLACHRALCERRRREVRGEPFDIQQDSDARYAAIMRAA